MWNFIHFGPSQQKPILSKKKKGHYKKGWAVYSGQWNLSSHDQRNSASLRDPMIISVCAQINQVDQHHAHDRCKIFTLVHL